MLFGTAVTCRNLLYILRELEAMLKALYFAVLFRRQYKGYVRTELLVDRN